MFYSFRLRILFLRPPFKHNIAHMLVWVSEQSAVALINTGIRSSIDYWYDLEISNSSLGILNNP